MNRLFGIVVAAAMGCATSTSGLDILDMHFEEVQNERVHVLRVEEPGATWTIFDYPPYGDADYCELREGGRTYKFEKGMQQCTQLYNTFRIARDKEDKPTVPRWY